MENTKNTIPSLNFFDLCDILLGDDWTCETTQTKLDNLVTSLFFNLPNSNDKGHPNHTIRNILFTALVEMAPVIIADLKRMKGDDYQDILEMVL